MARVKPEIRSDLNYVALDGEMVVYDPRNGDLHFLNHTAAVILDLADGTATIREISEEIADAYDEPVDGVERLVRTSMRQLRKRQLFEPTRKVSASEEEGEDADERVAIRRTVPPSI